MTQHPEPKQQKIPFSFTSAFVNSLPNCPTNGFYFDLPQEHSWDPKMQLTPWRPGSKICTQPQMTCPHLRCMSGHFPKLNYNRNSKTCRLLRLWIPILLLRHCGRSQPRPWLNIYNLFLKNAARQNICQRVGVMEYLLFSINLEQKDTQHRNFEPITLLEPTSKALLGVLSRHLLANVFDRLCRLPQFAYLSGRGTEDAICRVRDHCSRVRALFELNQYYIQHRALNMP